VAGFRIPPLLKTAPWIWPSGGAGGKRRKIIGQRETRAILRVSEGVMGVAENGGIIQINFGQSGGKNGFS
jgi:hypothetical protein